MKTLKWWATICVCLVALFQATLAKEQRANGIQTKGEFSEVFLIGDTILVGMTPTYNTPIIIQAFAMPSGKELWTHQIEEKVNCLFRLNLGDSVEVFDNSWLKGDPGLLLEGDKWLVALNLCTGRPMRINTGSELVRFLFMQDTVVTVSESKDNCKVQAFSITDGRELWNHILAAKDWSFRVLNDQQNLSRDSDFAWLGPSLGLLVEEKGRIYSLDLSTAKLTTIKTAVPSKFDHIIIRDHYLVGVYIDKNITVQAFSMPEGIEKWRQELEKGKKALDADCIWREDDLLMIGIDKLHAINLGTGQLQWTVNLGGIEAIAGIQPAENRLLIIGAKNVMSGQVVASCVEKANGQVIWRVGCKLHKVKDTLIPIEWSWTEGPIETLDLETGILFVNAERFHAIPLKDGVGAWEFNGHADTIAHTSDTAVYLIMEGKLVCLSLANGRLLWKSKDELRGQALLSGDRIYAQLGNHSVCLEALSGREIWSASGKVTGQLILKDTVVFASIDNLLHCLRVSDGSILWRSAGKTRGDFSLDKEVVYANLNDTLMALDDRTGAVKWRSKAIGEKTLFTATGEGRLMVLYPGKSEYKSLKDAWKDKKSWRGQYVLYCFSADDGRELWRFDHGRNILDYSFESGRLRIDDESRIWFIEPNAGEAISFVCSADTTGFRMGKNWLTRVDGNGNDLWKTKHALVTALESSGPRLPKEVAEVFVWDSKEAKGSYLYVIDTSFVVIPVEDKGMLGFGATPGIIGLSLLNGKELWKIELNSVPNRIIFADSLQFIVALCSKELYVMPLPTGR